MSQALCGESDPRNCNILLNLFQYLNNWSGECGVTTAWCASGNSLVSGSTPATKFYGYCAKPVTPNRLDDDDVTTSPEVAPIKEINYQNLNNEPDDEVGTNFQREL